MKQTSRSVNRSSRTKEEHTVEIKIVKVRETLFYLNPQNLNTNPSLPASMSSPGYQMQRAFLLTHAHFDIPVGPGIVLDFPGAILVPPCAIKCRCLPKATTNIPAIDGEIYPTSEDNLNMSKSTILSQIASKSINFSQIIQRLLLLAPNQSVTTSPEPPNHIPHNVRQIRT